MKKFKVEYQRCPGSPLKLAGEADQVHVLDDVDGTDLVIIGFGATSRVCESGWQFRTVIKQGSTAKVIITAQGGE